MRQRAGTEIAAQPASPARERPWLFNFLIAPDAVVTIGLINGALFYLLRNEGVNAARGAEIVALLSLPHAIFFLWGPLTDFWMSRRMWLMIMAAISAAVLLVGFHQAHLASNTAIVLLFLGACICEFTVAATGGIMGTLRSEVNRRRASSFYQSGSLAFGGLAMFALVSLAARFSLGGLGWVLAALVAIPALTALAAPPEQARSEPSLRATGPRIWSEFKSTFLRWKAIPYTLLITFPACSGAMIGLLPGLARDYGVSGAQVAWINGIAGALLMAAGAFAVTLVPTRVPAPIGFLTAGLINAGTLAILALGPLRPDIYYVGTVLFLFTIGGCWAMFTAVALEFLGDSGKSGSARFSIINSLGNVPVSYMAALDGLGAAHWGPRGMPATDAVLSAAGALLLFAHFVVSRRYRRSKQL